MTIHVLIADDDADFLDVTAYGLSRAGFTVTKVSNGEAAREAWLSQKPDILLLDAAMPRTSGFDLCEAVRSTSSTPVILVSGIRRESEIIRGFEVGADDYLTKPFSIRHLILRLKAIHRRVLSQATEVAPRQLTAGPLVIDLDLFLASIDGRPLQLTRLEMNLLYYLAVNLDRVVVTSKLIDFAWGLDGEADSSLLKTHISHIRSKLREASNCPVAIRARPGLGYSLHLGTEQTALIRR